MTTVPVPRLRAAVLALAALTLSLSACSARPAATDVGSAAPTTTRHTQGSRLPAPDHVVVVVMENHSYDDVLRPGAAPYLTRTLAAGGAVLTQSYAVAHPSQPNYYVLFSGSTQGVTDDSCVTPGFSSAPNLASELIAAHRSWASYDESLPARGSTVCTAGEYAQKHAPWFGFANVPVATALPLDRFPADHTRLPKVSFVIPNLCHDMHDCSVRTGDSWLQATLGSYATWARSHNSILLVTFDEDDGSADNRIPTVLYGAHVAPGSSSRVRYDHKDVLRTLEDLAGLSVHAGAGSDITGIWN